MTWPILFEAFGGLMSVFAVIFTIAFRYLNSNKWTTIQIRNLYKGTDGEKYHNINLKYSKVAK
jgi:hypothetical protein